MFIDQESVASKLFRARIEAGAGQVYTTSMSETAAPIVVPEVEQEGYSAPAGSLDPGYLVICWNDPVNLMVYVTHVFQVVFGWSRPKAKRHMLEVHQRGKSVLVRETLEKAEHYVHQLQAYGLQATMERDAA